MRVVKLIKIGTTYALTVPDSIVKLYRFKEGQLFDLEVKESNNMHEFLFLTYAIKVN